MILVILPLGKEASQIRDWAARVIMYTAASAVGASILAAALGLVGRGLRLGLEAVGLGGAIVPVSVGILGTASILFALHEFNIIRLPNPQMGWQVPKSWMKSSRLLGNTLYGIVLGMGIFTFIPFASFYVLLAWELVAGMFSLKAAVAIGLTYGLIRGIPAVLGGISMLRDVYPLPVTDWLQQHLGWWHALNGLALFFVGAFLLGSFFV